MLKRFVWNDASKDQKIALLQRPNEEKSQGLRLKVNEIIRAVQLEKDSALFAYTKQFDDVVLSSLAVSCAELDAAMNQVSPKIIQAFERVINQLKRFHQHQQVSNYVVETTAGVVCERVVVPIQRVGLYVPAGSAPLVSTVLMLGVPSQMATCPLRVLCVPPNKAGDIDPQILVAARCCGIDTIFKIGGAQAIAAMAYGTETIPKVDKIFGPGNAWVTMAKMLVSLDPNGAQQDLPAGPSEVLVIADDMANPAFVAADLLSQAEHGEDSQVILLCMSEAFAQEVNRHMEEQLKSLSRAHIAMQSLKHSLCLVVKDAAEAISIANEYAPEHLIIQTVEPRLYLSEIYTAGSVFLGPWSPEAVGDYASGTNHILPTAGFARSSSGLSLQDFMRSMSVQEISREGLASLAETIGILTDIEGLDAHQQAIDVRLQALRGLMQSMIHLARKAIQELVPYSSARSESNQIGIQLDANENPFCQEFGFNRYPKPQPPILRQRLADKYGVQASQLMITRGSDEGIDLLVRVFCEANRDSILTTPPTYGMYEVAARIQGADVKTIALQREQGFALNKDGILQQWQPGVKLIFLCSPNNPTGNVFKPHDLLSLCEQLHHKAIVVVDEAYVEFSTQDSLCSFVSQYPNLVILRTLSKAFGLAGVRVGSLIANEELIALFMKVLAPYPIPLPVEMAALNALNAENQALAHSQICSIREQRDQLTCFLEGLASVESVYPSEANFLLVRVNDALHWMSTCKKHHVIIRSRDKIPDLQNCVRITIGTPYEMERLKEVLSYV